LQETKKAEEKLLNILERLSLQLFGEMVGFWKQIIKYQRLGYCAIIVASCIRAFLLVGYKNRNSWYTNIKLQAIGPLYFIAYIQLIIAGPNVQGGKKKYDIMNAGRIRSVCITSVFVWVPCNHWKTDL
jgi:hypothetical protein